MRRPVYVVSKHRMERRSRAKTFTLLYDSLEPALERFQQEYGCSPLARDYWKLEDVRKTLETTHRIDFAMGLCRVVLQRISHDDTKGMT